MKLGMKIGIGSLGALLFMVIFGYVLFPKIITSQVKKMTNLKKGTDVRDLFLKLPFPLKLKVSMFNVTNSDDVTVKGVKPILQEVGPFVYDEWKEKIDIVENNLNDTLLYTIRNTFIFNQADSGALTGNEVITMLHPLTTGILMLIVRDKPGALSLVNKAFLSIFGNVDSVFLTTTVNEILFSGVTILCNVTDFAGKAVCSQLKAEVKGLVEEEPGIFKFSILGGKNGTKGPKIKVKRGIKNSHDTGRMVEFEGKPELDIWGSKECNQLLGTDSTIFPPFLTKEEGLQSFTADICRSLPAIYKGESTYGGLPVWKYTADYGDMSVDYNKCYCLTPESCFKKGIHDLSKCIKAPFVVSLPHFYQADQSYLDAVVGLNPEEAKHEIIVLFEHMTGSPVYAKKRIQYNIPVQAVPKYAGMKNFPELVFPLFWIEEGVELNKTWTGQIKNQLFLVLKIMKVLKYLVIAASIGGIAAGMYLHFTTKNEVSTIKQDMPDNDKKVDGISTIARQQINNMGGGHVNHAVSNMNIDKF